MDPTNAPRAAARLFKACYEADANPAARALLCRLMSRLFADPLLSLDHLVKLGLMLSHTLVFRSHALVAVISWCASCSKFSSAFFFSFRDNSESFTTSLGSPNSA